MYPDPVNLTANESCILSGKKDQRWKDKYRYISKYEKENIHQKWYFCQEVWLTCRLKGT